MVVRHLGKVIDIKGGYEDVKGILAELEFSARPFESRAGGVRATLGDSVVSDPGIKEKGLGGLARLRPLVLRTSHWRQRPALPPSPRFWFSK